MIIQYLNLVREVRRLYEGENDCGHFVKNKISRNGQGMFHDWANDRKR